jgi:hypothetical protein
MRIHFVIDQSFLDLQPPADLEGDWASLSSLSQATIYLTCLHIKEAYPEVTFSSTLVPKAINIAHPSTLLSFQPKSFIDCYIICWQQDYPRCVYANEHIVMNRSQTKFQSLKLKDILCFPGKRTVLHYPPDPALVPRNLERKDRFETIGYFGDPKNLLPEIQSEDWKKRLESHGMRLVIRDARSESSIYQDLDAVVAIRPKNFPSNQKSGHKLWNAWRAGTPAILGQEPGFLDYKTSSLDYIEANTPQEAMDALIMLKSQPQLVRSMRERGLLRTEEISTSSLIQQWVQHIERTSKSSAKNWLNTPNLLRFSFITYRQLIYHLHKRLSRWIAK